MSVVVIDDERTFSTVHVDRYIRTSNSALAYLAKFWVDYELHYADPIEVLWLDHDLGEGDRYQTTLN